MKITNHMEFIAQGIGHAFYEYFSKQDLQELVEKLGNVQLAIEMISHEEGDDGPYVHRSHFNATVEQIAKELQDDRYYEPGQFASITNISQLQEMYDEYIDSSDCHLRFFGTPEKYAERRKEERFVEMSRIAKKFSATCKKGIGTFDFIRELEDAISQVNYSQENWNSGERRMEEWANHMYAGGGSQTYFDDHNFENGRMESRLDELHSIFDWLEQECPLLMAKYHEMKLAGTWEKEEVEV